MELFDIINRSIRFNFINEAAKGEPKTAESIASELDLKRKNPKTGNKWTDDEIINYVKANVKELIYGDELGLISKELSDELYADNTAADKTTGYVKAMSYDEKVLVDYIRDLKNEFIDDIFTEFRVSPPNAKNKEIVARYNTAKRNYDKMLERYNSIKKRIADARTESMENADPAANGFDPENYSNETKLARHNINKVIARSFSNLEKDEYNSYKKADAEIAVLKAKTELSEDDKTLLAEYEKIKNELDKKRMELLSADDKAIIKHEEDFLSHNKNAYDNYIKLTQQKNDIKKKLDELKKSLVATQSEFVDSITDVDMKENQDYKLILNKFRSNLISFSLILAELKNLDTEDKEDGSNKYKPSAKKSSVRKKLYGSEAAAEARFSEANKDTYNYVKAFAKYLPDEYEKISRKLAGEESAHSKMTEAKFKKADTVLNNYITEFIKNMPVIIKSAKSMLAEIQAVSKDNADDTTKSLMDETARKIKLLLKNVELLNAQHSKSPKNPDSASLSKYNDDEVNDIVNSIPKKTRNQILNSISALLYQSVDENGNIISNDNISFDAINTLYKIAQKQNNAELKSGIEEYKNTLNKLSTYYKKWYDINRSAQELESNASKLMWSDEETLTDKADMGKVDKNVRDAETLSGLYKEMEIQEGKLKEYLNKAYAESYSAHTVKGGSLAGVGKGGSGKDENLLAFQKTNTHIAGVPVKNSNMPNVVMAKIPFTEFKYMRDGIHLPNSKESINKIQKIADLIFKKHNDVKELRKSIINSIREKVLASEENKKVIDTDNKWKQFIALIEDAGPTQLDDAIEFMQANNNNIDISPDVKSMIKAVLPKLSELKSELAQYAAQYTEYDYAKTRLYYEGVFYTGDIGININAQGKMTNAQTTYNIDVPGIGTINMKERPCDVGIIVADKSEQTMDWDKINKLYDEYKGKHIGDMAKNYEKFQEITDDDGNISILFNIILMPRESIIREAYIEQKNLAGAGKTASSDNRAKYRNDIIKEYNMVLGLTARQNPNMTDHMDIGYMDNNKFIKVGYVPFDLLQKGSDGAPSYTWILGMESDPLYKVVIWSDAENKKGEKYGLLFDIQTKDIDNIDNVKGMIVDKHGNYSLVDKKIDPDTQEISLIPKEGVRNPVTGALIKDYSSVMTSDDSGYLASAEAGVKDLGLESIDNAMHEQYNKIKNMYAGISLPKAVNDSISNVTQKIAEIPVDRLEKLSPIDIDVETKGKRKSADGEEPQAQAEFKNMPKKKIDEIPQMDFRGQE